MFSGIEWRKKRHEFPVRPALPSHFASELGKEHDTTIKVRTFEGSILLPEASALERRRHGSQW